MNGGVYMPELIHELVLHRAEIAPEGEALAYRGSHLSYDALATQIVNCAAGFLRLGLARAERIAVYLEKRIETVVASSARQRPAGCSCRSIRC